MATKIDVPETLTDLLNGANTAVLTTVGADGLPQSTAVWYLFDEDGILKTSITVDRQKYKNLARHPRATLFILDPTNPYRTIEIRANVELTPDPDKALLPVFAEKVRRAGGGAAAGRGRPRRRHLRSRADQRQWLRDVSTPSAHRSDGSISWPRRCPRPT
jgi:PPOX class probable F420-dependent enzyme